MNREASGAPPNEPTAEELKKIYAEYEELNRLHDECFAMSFLEKMFFVAAEKPFLVIVLPANLGFILGLIARGIVG